MNFCSQLLEDARDKVTRLDFIHSGFDLGMEWDRLSRGIIGMLTTTGRFHSLSGYEPDIRASRGNSQDISRAVAAEAQSLWPCADDMRVASAPCSADGSFRDTRHNGGRRRTESFARSETTPYTKLSAVSYMSEELWIACFNHERSYSMRRSKRSSLRCGS